MNIWTFALAWIVVAVTICTGWVIYRARQQHDQEVEDAGYLVLAAVIIAIVLLATR